MTLLHRAEALGPELIRIRRDLHAHPELGFEEFRTAALVADTLRELGLNPRTGIGRTGVVAEIGPDHGPILAIRADMDALPIDEQNDVPYRSTRPGVMHACGHDAHTAILLGVAHLLRQESADGGWQGRVRLLFQPSEEKADANGISGARAMMDDGALEGVSAAIALHVFSGLEAGVCAFQDGYSLASSDKFEAWIRGTGGHGAYPHTTTDPIFMLGHILNALYAIPGRRIDPQESCVLSVGQVHAGAASNVIPAEVYLHGTVRTYRTEVREQIMAEIERVLGIADALGGSHELRVQVGTPSLYNDPVVNGWLRESALGMVSADSVRSHRFGMGYEDFAIMAQAVPGAMFGLGARLEDGVSRAHHTPLFDIDERVLPIGAAVLAQTALRFVRGNG
jgi:amidohydrolase